MTGCIYQSYFELLSYVTEIASSKYRLHYDAENLLSRFEFTSVNKITESLFMTLANALKQLHERNNAFQIIKQIIVNFNKTFSSILTCNSKIAELMNQYFTKLFISKSKKNITKKRK